MTPWQPECVRLQSRQAAVCEGTRKGGCPPPTGRFADGQRSALLRTKGWYRNLLPQAIVLGLYVSRLIAESSVGPWRFRLLVPLCLGAMALSFALLVPVRRIIPCTWPVVILLAYVLWPWAAPGLGWAVLLVAACVTLAANPRPLRGTAWLEASVGIASLALYVSTLAPTVLPADSGEYQLVSHVLGIAHPPGYALYTLLGKAFTLLPVGDVAYRVNLFAAVCGAMTLVLIARAVRQGTGSCAAALVASATLGLSTTFWAQSTTANIRSLTALFTALCLVILLRWGEDRTNGRLAALGACFGLGVWHHLSLVLFTIPFLAYMLACEPRLIRQPRRWLPGLGAFVASFVILLYLPVRSLMAPSFDPAPIRSWGGFINHVLALGFRGDMLYYRTLPELAARLGVWRDIMLLQFGPLLLGAGLLAALPLGARRWRVLLLLAGTWAVNVVSVMTYRAPQTVEYLIPSYVALVMLLGYGLGLTLRAPLRRSLGGALIGLLLLVAGGIGVANYPSFRLLHGDTSARDYAEAILRDAPPSAVVLTNWHRATPFWYLQQVEGLRPDVEVRYVYPQGGTPNDEVWLQRIAQDVSKRPVIVTNRFYAYEQTAYRWIPFHDAWLVREGPLEALPQGIELYEADFGPGIRILGYQLDSVDLSPGAVLSLRVYWQPTEPLERDYSSFVQLVGPGGVAGQGDIVHRSRDYQPGEVRVDAYRFPLLLHASPGEYRLITSFYYNTGGGWQRLLTQGQDHLVLEDITVLPGREPAATLHSLGQHFAGGLILAGVDYDRSVAGQTRLYLHWQRARQYALISSDQPGRQQREVRVCLLYQGTVVAQGVLPFVEPGFALTTALDVPDGPERLVLTLADSEGHSFIPLGPWHLPSKAELSLRLPRGEARYVPLAGEMAFTGFEYLPRVATPGQSVWMRPRFLALRPLTADYTVSVGLRVREPSWEKKTDSTPALGAIPTFKWVRGWLVEDPHLLAIPSEAPRAQAAATVGVYDAFTLEPLRILDERLVAEGQGTQLELGRVDIAAGPGP
jgi:hypothetical protein